MAVEIVEILRRSDQGVTRPFICRGDDGNTYFVKGRGAGARSLIAEWICGRLARAFGLPIADFAIVQIPEEFSAPRLIPEFNELGVGPAFGSMALRHVQEISLAHLQDVDVQTQQDVLVFDWWVRNEDRTLTGHGGNPNLLWDQDRKSLVVIDHNQAFDRAFNIQHFLELHVFSEVSQAVFSDFHLRAEYQSRLKAAFVAYGNACSDVPAEWWSNAEGVPVDFDRDAARALLEKCTSEDFWRTEP